MRVAARAALASAAALLICLPAAIGPAAAAEGDSAKATTSVSKPPIVSRLIPFGPKRKREMAAYSKRHYGQGKWRLRQPRVIVEHMAQTTTAAAVFNTFAPDVPDVELGELPNVCSHFVVGPSGRIYRLVNLRTRCRHTVGLNWTAIGIEHVGYGDGDVLGNRRQLRASLRLSLEPANHMRYLNLTCTNGSCLRSPGRPSQGARVSASMQFSFTK